ncbi:conjugal transfer protein, partial [Vibrio cholerae]|nr:conjugal transfer protein [Vibrio cholerae]
DKQSWNDVLMAIGKIAIAGGSILAAEFAWSIWGS